MNKKWEFYENDINLSKEISEKCNISEFLSCLLVNRGLKNSEQIKVFLDPTRNDFYDPFLMPDMKKAIDRIVKAITNKEKVIIYGDYDVDGITSVTVLKNYLEDRGLQVDYYIPNRIEEGYGLNKKAIEEISKNKYTLMITVDCGISGIEEIDYANNLGIETIITDHHEQVNDIPNAYAVIDAKRKDSLYPFRELAGVGVVFKVIQAISKELKLDDKEHLKYLDIVCIGTISDIVPLIDENRVIAKLGLLLVKQTKNIGLRALIEETGYKKIDSTAVSFGIAPRINACGRMGHQDEALQLFLSDEKIKAKEITNQLNMYNIQRQETEKQIFKQALEEIEKENIDELNSIILSGDNWNHGVIGIVASKITEKLYKPTILICFEGEKGKGSGRSINGFDLHEALVESGQYLEKYGGHEMAIGLTIKKENYEKFKAKFNQIAISKRVNELVPVIKIDKKITLKEINKEMIEDLEKLEPFGESNKLPIFLCKNVRIESIRALSEGKHLKLTLKEENNIISAIGFNLGELANEYLIGDKIDIVGTIEKNNYNGEETLQINIKDIMKSI